MSTSNVFPFFTGSAKELAWVISGVVLMYVYLHRRRSRQLANARHLPTPPGPKPWPIIGNICVSRFRFLGLSVSNRMSICRTFHERRNHWLIIRWQRNLVSFTGSLQFGFLANQFSRRFDLPQRSGDIHPRRQ